MSEYNTLTLDELLDNFQVFDDWEDKYAYLLDLGKKLPHMEETLKIEANKVQGCVSQVWLVVHPTPDGFLSLQMDSDAHLVRGLAAILYIVFNKMPIKEFANVDIDGIFKEIGLIEHLTPNRRNGFMSMVEKIKSFST